MRPGWLDSRTSSSMGAQVASRHPGRLRPQCCGMTRKPRSAWQLPCGRSRSRCLLKHLWRAHQLRRFVHWASFLGAAMGSRHPLPLRGGITQRLRFGAAGRPASCRLCRDDLQANCPERSRSLAKHRPSSAVDRRVRSVPGSSSRRPAATSGVRARSHLSRWHEPPGLGLEV